MIREFTIYWTLLLANRLAPEGAGMSTIPEMRAKAVLEGALGSNTQIQWSIYSPVIDSNCQCQWTCQTLGPQPSPTCVLWSKSITFWAIQEGPVHWEIIHINFVDRSTLGVLSGVKEPTESWQARSYSDSAALAPSDVILLIRANQMADRLGHTQQHRHRQMLSCWNTRR